MKISELYDAFQSSGGISTDTRSLQAGQLFLALRGENFDGHDFVEVAISAGAKFAIVDSRYKGDVDDSKLFRVPDTLQALQQLATYHREQLGTPVLAIGGSNGKTTTKNLVNAVLRTSLSVCSTPANNNNHIGVPLTLLSANKDHDLIVVELGTNHPGEMQVLIDIAKPSHGIITNIGEEHLEFFGDLEAVAKEELSLFRYLEKSGGVAIVNHDDIRLMSESQDIRRHTYSTASEDADYYLEAKVSPYVEVEGMATKFFGQHNAINICAAVAIGNVFDISREQALSAVTEFTPKENRSEVMEVLDKELTLVLDGYNANPSSMRAALKAFADFPQDNKVVILSEMLEMGAVRARVHAEIYNFAKELRLSSYYFVGDVYQDLVDDSDKYFNSTQDLIDSGELKDLQDAAVLVKGSKGTNIRFVREVWGV